MFLSYPWFENLTETALEAGQSMLLACVVEDDKVLAILPLQQHPDGEVRSLTHRYSALFSLLINSENQAEILVCLAEGLHRLHFKTLILEPFDKNNAAIRDFRQALVTHGFSCHQGFRFFNWVYHVEGRSFEEYMAERPGRLRNTIARKRRKLERERGFKIRLFSNDNVAQGLADYTTVYNSSWKARELYGTFLEGLVSRFAVPGWLRLAVLYIDDRPAAAQIWFVVEHKASIFRLAYDEAWRQYSPGSILTHYLMAHVIDIDKVEEIDFLTGNERYKQDWMSEQRERWGMNCQNIEQPEKRSHNLVHSLRHFFTRLK